MTVHDRAEDAFRAVYDSEITGLEGQAVQARAELALVEQERDRALTDIAGFKVQLEESDDVISTLTQKVAELEAKIRELETQVPRSKTLVGVYNGTSSSADAQFEGFGLKATIATSYYTTSGPRPMPVPQSWDVARMGKGIFPQVHFQSTQNGVQTYFWKDVADGKHDQWFIDMAKKLHIDFGGKPFSFTFDGEPEVRIERAGTGNWIQKDPRNTPEYYAAAFRRIVTVMRPHAPSMDSRFWIAGHLRTNAMDAYYPGREYVDSIGVDPYIWGYDTPTTGPLEKWKPAVDFVRNKWGQGGVPIGISETGFARSHGDDAQAAFWAKVPAAVKTLDLSWVLLFNRGDFKMDDLPKGRAALVKALNEIGG